MTDLPILGAQLSVLDLDRHRDWLFEKNRDLELPEFCLPDILADPEPFVDKARAKLDGWQGRLGIHGPFPGFELNTTDREMRAAVQKRLDQALGVCERLGATQMVIHSPYDHWDSCNLDNAPRDRSKSIGAILDTLSPALDRAEDQGVEMVLENIRDTDPALRRAVIEAADSPALRLSVDTGHAHWAHVVCDAPPADRFLTDAGGALDHVHLQDSDGYADRHWPLGRGNICWFGLFEALDRVGGRPRLIVEINDFDRVEESARHLEALGLAQ